jgi:hypothetical protein
MEKPLSEEDQELLDRFERGEVSLEETSRIVAAKAIERMFKNPDSVKFIDFFRMEFLKLKQEENNRKENWGQALLKKLFVGGKLPPKYCPHCGEPVFKDSFDDRKIEEPDTDDKELSEVMKLD